ncbi:MAG: undecaprenyl-diphosphate phosphatase [Flavobacteriaceae bacterium]|nr:undecaprenyl-diphosphate phosphatase [Flavobacteriaceae bacterium]
MEVVDAILLGIIQGFTEFLPVSSSGHLELGKAILGDESMPKESLLFTVVLHFATALSTIVVFRKDIWEIVKGLLQFSWNKESQFSVKIILSMFPAVFIGIFFERELESLFGANITLVGFMLMITALLLWLADNAKETGKKISYKNAFIIGVSQAIAVLPGISRSGATISTSVLLGNDKNKAARFSFLMVVPLIFGKIIMDLRSGNLSSQTENVSALGFGFLAAFICGLIACTWMISLVKRSKLNYFAIYCFIVGMGTIIFGYYN